MNILLVHNYYQQAGGEDQVFAAEADLLEAKGHSVHRYTVHNDAIQQKNPLAVATTTVWNREIYQELRSQIRQHQIQLAHFHNTFPLISPAAYYAAKAENIPVIQTCHNYRLLCPNALFYRAGKVCEDCLGRAPWAGVVHRCYRGSLSASAVTAATITLHRAIGTPQQVDRYIALTEFSRQKFIQGGIPAAKLVVKPNFVHPDPGYQDGSGGYAIFVGRLSQEKGIDLLLTAWKQLGDRIPLKIVGDGPLATEVAAQQSPGVEWLGRRSLEEVYGLLGKAAFLVFPSKWYEGFPRIIVEALAVGTPIVGADIGSIHDLILPGQTGLRFTPGDAVSLVKQVQDLLEQPDRLQQMRRAARAEFEAHYTAERNYQQLMEIYDQV
ncbi:MAG: glycosyltransferase family 4 protein [Leptolyngbyaceae cyanobacterium SL_7_1]|nr:glycosyltransferase family 4 protein [Leptolyngbyaceae cyanobacterium SL_7_1]